LQQVGSEAVAAIGIGFGDRLIEPDRTECERAGGNRDPRLGACTAVARVPIAAEQRALQLQRRVGLRGVDLDRT